MENKQKWKNFGDINYIAYGGCLVRKHWDEETLKEHPEWNTEFDVFQLITEAGDKGNQLAATFHCIDVKDYEKEKKDILFYIGLEDKVDLPMEEIMSMEMWAKEIVEYGDGTQPSSYISDYPESWEDCFLTEEELRDWLEKLGVETREIYYND